MIDDLGEFFAVIGLVAFLLGGIGLLLLAVDGWQKPDIRDHIHEPYCVTEKAHGKPIERCLKAIEVKR